MPTTITYSDIIMYLDAIATKAIQSLNSAGCPHGYWWRVNQMSNQPPLAYHDFLIGSVYNVTDGDGNNIPIIGTDSNRTNPAQSLFYILLTTPGGYTLTDTDGATQYFPQMPKGGHYITDPDYEVQLGNDGPTIKGSDIATNLADWLSNGYPEK